MNMRNSEWIDGWMVEWMLVWFGLVSHCTVRIQIYPTLYKPGPDVGSWLMGWWSVGCMLPTGYEKMEETCRKY